MITLLEGRVESWLGWIMVTFNPHAPTPSEVLKDVKIQHGYLDMEHCIEAFREEFH